MKYLSYALLIAVPVFFAWITRDRAAERKDLVIMIILIFTVSFLLILSGCTTSSTPLLWKNLVGVEIAPRTVHQTYYIDGKIAGEIIREVTYPADIALPLILPSMIFRDMQESIDQGSRIQKTESEPAEQPQYKNLF